MKNKNFWSILLFAGMFIVAGVSFNSCEQKSSGGSGGGGSEGGGGGGSTVTDSLEHCWQVILQYKGDPEKDTIYVWETKKEIEKEIQEAKKDSAFSFVAYNLSTAKTESECEATDIDPDVPMCWRVTVSNKEGQSYTEYMWGTKNEILAAEKDALKEGMQFEYYESYAEDEYSCLEKNGNDPEPSVPAVYIKHPWGTGQDASWSWEQMNYDNSGEYYYYYGAWGGVGANINDAPTDADAVWYPEDEIYGANNCSMGDYVEFRYVNGSLSVYLY